MASTSTGDPTPLDENLLKEVRLVLFLVNRLQPPPFDENGFVRLHRDVLGQQWAEHGRLWFTFIWDSPSTPGDYHYFEVSYLVEHASGRIIDLSLPPDMSDERKFQWLVWFTAYLKGPRQIAE